MIHGHAEAYEDVVLIDRGMRTLLRVSGRSPLQMLQGMVTGAMPAPLRTIEGTEGLFHGQMSYSAMLTPKGRMVSDLRIGRLPDVDETALLIDLPPAGSEAARKHFTRYLPPRFATVEDPAEPAAALALVGPGAARTLVAGFPGQGLGTEILGALEEGESVVMHDGSELGLHVVRSGDVIPPAFEVLGGQDSLRSLRDRVLELGVEEAGVGLWRTLRMERGRPAFGEEMDEGTLLPEAGIQRRAVDDTKGCYTGQEVVVRIRDRGHVNQHLRGLLLGSTPLPDPGTPLFQPGRDRPVGEVRSAVESPRMGQGIALAYVRREAQPPTSVHLGSSDGPEALVRALTDAGWSLTETDPVPSVGPGP